jgi:Protein of unknown function (DUF3224)
MATHAEGTFDVTSWDENPYEEIGGGAKLTRASIGQKLSGDLEATGTSEVLMYYRPDGTATFTGYQRVVGRIGDRSGSFVLQSTGAFDGNEARTAWSVVPGSATDGLEGLRGEGVAVAPPGMRGTFTLDYDLG